MSFFYQKLPFTIQTSDYFSLEILPLKRKTLIDMQMLIPTLNTYAIPTLLTLLESELPGVLYSRCFNEQNLPFEREVVHTEIGHLFEHILLEYLCQLKIDHGFSEAMYKGVTNWDWTKDTRGLFHISISAGVDDLHVLQLALESTITLVNKILQPTALPIEPTIFSYQNLSTLQTTEPN